MLLEMVKALLCLELTLRVQEIIGDMFFHPDDHGSISRQWAIQLFMRQTTKNEVTIMIKKSMEFYMAIDFISHSFSFRAEFPGVCWEYYGFVNVCCRS